MTEIVFTWKDSGYIETYYLSNEAASKVAEMAKELEIIEKNIEVNND